MRKKFVVDTSVFVYDPNSYLSFEGNDIIIPITVLDELDKLKKQPSEAGKNARVFIRTLDRLSTLGDITKGIELENNITLKIDSLSGDGVSIGDPLYGDNRILACALAVKKAAKKTQTVLITKDINLRIRGKVLGIDSQDYEKDKIQSSELYAGFQSVEDEDAGLYLKEKGHLDAQAFNLKMLPNECVEFTDDLKATVSYGRKIGKNVSILKEKSPWGLTARNKEQAFAINLLMDKNIPLVTLIGKAGSGKTLVTVACALEAVLERKMYEKIIVYRPVQAMGNEAIGFLPGPQPLDAKILTPNGWTTMGQLKIGDDVISRDGMPSKVLNIFPKGTKSVYKITTTDGTSTEACEDHLWYTTTNKKGSVKTTKEILNSLDENHVLPRNEPVHYNKTDLPLHPYLIGAFLGDGSCTDSHLTIYSKDKEIIDRITPECVKFDCHVLQQKANQLSFRIYSNKQIGKSGAKNVKITNILNNDSRNYKSIGHVANLLQITPASVYKRITKKRIVSNSKIEYLDTCMNSSHPMIEILQKLNLSRVIGYNKFIPKQYLYASIEDRIDLLRGLMDTDGTIKKNGEMSYCTTSKQLALDMIELVRSLGGRATLISRDRIGKSNKVNNIDIICRRISYEFTISIPNINPFYLKRKAERFNFNRKISNIKIKSIEYAGEKPVQCILIDNPEHLYITDEFIVTHNTEQEKLAPWMQPIMDSFEFLFQTKVKGEWKKNFEIYQKKGVIEMNALAFIRGRSIPNTLMIIDEVQNLSREETKTILTRAGNNTKIVMTGDIEQIDNSHLDAMNNGLTYVVEKFKDSELAGHVTFTKGERSPLATKAAEIL